MNSTRSSFIVGLDKGRTGQASGLVSVLGSVVGILLILLIPAILNGCVISILWSWFVIPIFQAPALPVISAAVVAMTIRVVTSRPGNSCSSHHLELSSLPAIVAELLVMLKEWAFTIRNPVYILFIGLVLHMWFV